MLAASMPNQAPTSWLRPIWPSCLALFSFCWVGCSVFSPLIPPPPRPGGCPPPDRRGSAATEVHHGGDRLVDDAGQDARQHGDRGSGEGEDQEDLRREPELERVERGRHPVQQAERGVGEKQHR